jgi:NAD(P)-dependent dehydrogenase (short-subunit alcohol dehydrogenase family)
MSAQGGKLVNRHGEPLRALVIGASSGIGASTARALVDSGALVVGAARRTQRIDELEGVVPVACDVTDPDECDGAVAEAVEVLGGLDALIYAAGTTGITPLHTTGREAWLEFFATNMFGAALVSRAALPHLQAPTSDGRAIFLTSDSAVKPYPGLVVYGASKAALSAFCQGLSAECPTLQVTEVMVGPTVDTEVGTHFDMEEFGYWFDRWCAEGYVRYGYQMAADVAAVLLEVVRADKPDRLVLAAAEQEEPLP